MRRACRSTSDPHSVSTTPVRLLAIRSAPIMDSSRRMCALTAGWVRSRRWAVLVKLPSSQMATNVRSRSVGILVLPAIVGPPLTSLLCRQLSCIARPVPCRRVFYRVPMFFLPLSRHAGKGPSRPGGVGGGPVGLEPVTPRVDERHGGAGQDHNSSNGCGAEHRDQAPA